MRHDKLGHFWKWRGNDGYAVCPFCGLERKFAERGKKGGTVAVSRLIGSSDQWETVMPRCKKLLRIGGTHRFGRRGKLFVSGLYLAWPARLVCFDPTARSSRMVTIPVLAYWRARRAR